MALSSTEAEYVALTFAAKRATWIRLLLGLLDVENQYSEIKVIQRSNRTEQIKADAVVKEGKALPSP